jgi:hypothetical protein
LRVVGFGFRSKDLAFALLIVHLKYLYGWGVRGFAVWGGAK